MSIDWIRVDLDLPEHPKLLMLESTIGEGALKALFRVWRFAAKARRDGKLRGPAEVELAGEWRGTSGAFHAALLAAGFLDADGVTLHDWMHHQGENLEALLHRRETTAQRVARHRAMRSSSSPTPPSPPTTTTTPTATATGTPLQPPLRNALRNALHEECNDTGMPVRSNGNGEWRLPWIEYQAAGGPSPEASYEKMGKAAVAAGVARADWIAWHRSNPGRLAWHANEALVPRPESPKKKSWQEIENEKFRAMMGGGEK